MRQPLALPTLALGLALALCACAAAPDPASRILDIRQYAELRHEVPYVLEFSTGRGALLLYGAEHSSDPAKPQVAEIETQWRRFAPSVAYNEGGHPPALDDRELAVRRYGEAGLLRHLAARDQVPVATFEPAPRVEADALQREGGSAERVKTFLALRTYLSFRRSQRDERADDFMARLLARPHAGLGGATQSPATLEALDRVCTQEFGLNDWRAVPDTWFDPTQDMHFTNRMARASGVLRDRHILQLLVKRARSGDRVFAVIGASHVPMLEPALMAALGAPKGKREGLLPERSREPR